MPPRGAHPTPEAAGPGPLGACAGHEGVQVPRGTTLTLRRTEGPPFSGFSSSLPTSPPPALSIDTLPRMDLDRVLTPGGAAPQPLLVPQHFQHRPAGGAAGTASAAPALRLRAGAWSWGQGLPPACGEPRLQLQYWSPLAEGKPSIRRPVEKPCCHGVCFLLNWKRISAWRARGHVSTLSWLFHPCHLGPEFLSHTRKNENWQPWPEDGASLGPCLSTQEPICPLPPLTCYPQCPPCPGCAEGCLQAHADLPLASLSLPPMLVSAQSLKGAKTAGLVCQCCCKREYTWLGCDSAWAQPLLCSEIRAGTGSRQRPGSGNRGFLGLRECRDAWVCSHSWAPTLSIQKWVELPPVPSSHQLHRVHSPGYTSPMAASIMAAHSRRATAAITFTVGYSSLVTCRPPTSPCLQHNQGNRSWKKCRRSLRGRCTCGLEL
ncbi:uncharacterized protein [Macaca nemestrina]|uniref:uncharacterized protein n=1 Tax=Macaca nemestrina TaxID=9545 RepID=UPI0039B90FDD